MRFVLTSVVAANARQAVGRRSDQRPEKSPRRKFTIPRHAIDFANWAEKALMHD